MVLIIITMNISNECGWLCDYQWSIGLKVACDILELVNNASKTTQKYKKGLFFVIFNGNFMQTDKIRLSTVHPIWFNNNKKASVLYIYFFLLNSSTRQLSFCKQTIHYRCSFQDEELKFYFNQSNISIVGIKSNYKVGIFEPQPSIFKSMYRTTIVV